MLPRVGNLTLKGEHGDHKHRGVKYFSFSVLEFESQIKMSIAENRLQVSLLNDTGPHLVQRVPWYSSSLCE